jgi:monolysocardiolipin acyltransferase
MPEGRRAPWKFLPRQGARLSVTFGAPLLPAVVRATMASASGMAPAPAPRCDDGEGEEQPESTGMPVKMDAEAEVKVRIALTELMQRAVEVLGRQVSGDSLTGWPHDHHHDHHRT